MEESSKNTFSGIGFLYDMVEVLASALIVVAVLFIFFFRMAGVDGASMNDTLQDKDRLIMYNFCYTPKRGDIVIVNRYHAGATVVEEPLIKRVIGVAGDTVKVTADTVYLNGKALDEPYINYPNQPCDVEVTVPEGQVFVMGDHRNNSNDSRHLGCFDVEDIMGKALWRVFPTDEFGSVYD